MTANWQDGGAVPYDPARTGAKYCPACGAALYGAVVVKSGRPPIHLRCHPTKRFPFDTATGERVPS